MDLVDPGHQSNHIMFLMATLQTETTANNKHDKYIVHQVSALVNGLFLAYKVAVHILTFSNLFSDKHDRTEYVHCSQKQTCLSVKNCCIKNEDIPAGYIRVLPKSKLG